MFRIALLKEVKLEHKQANYKILLEYNQDQVVKRIKRTMDSLLLDKEKTTEAIHNALDDAWKEIVSEFEEQIIRMP